MKKYRVVLEEIDNHAFSPILRSLTKNAWPVLIEQVMPKYMVEYDKSIVIGPTHNNICPSS